MEPEKANRRLFIVSSRIPLNLVKRNDAMVLEETSSPIASALTNLLGKGGQGLFHSATWVGLADFSISRWNKSKESLKTELLYDVHPVFLETKIRHQFHSGFCAATIWPIFHYFPSFAEFEDDAYLAYKEINELVAKEIQSLCGPNDIIWIQDYHFFLVPGLIRAACPKATIGFFLHIPFPSFEVFRLLGASIRNEIVNGMLGADLIGFHTNSYVGDFLRTVQMNSGYDHEFRNVMLDERTIRADMFPLGIDFASFSNSNVCADLNRQTQIVRANFPDQKIIFSIDRLEYTKGISHRLLGYESFLETYPEWRGKVIFIMIVIPSRQLLSKYSERKTLIEETIGRINGNHSTLGWQPINYRFHLPDKMELMTLYQVADVGMVTPLRDGMNLMAKEFVASRQRTDGVLILSELAGASHELSEAILVNPFDRSDLCEGIFKALSMPEEQQQERIQRMQTRLRQYDVSKWMEDFLTQLDGVKLKQTQNGRKLLSQQHLGDMLQNYGASTARLLLLDYDGTLSPFSTKPDLAVPDESLLLLLEDLASIEKNHVAIISGRDNISLDRWFGHLPVTLISEHGAGIRNRGEAWRFDPDIDQYWKRFVRPTFENFCTRTPGSFIEDKLHTLVWHYRNADAELGFVRSRELLDTLHHLARNAKLNIIDGNKVVEIRTSSVDKGVVTKALISAARYDFIMGVGDDETDENMFKVLPSDAYSIKVGQVQSQATFYVNNQHHVLDVLHSLLIKDISYRQNIDH